MNSIVYYIRCSSSEQEPELQIKDIDLICNKSHEIFKENQSAFAENVVRPVFNSLIKLIKQRKVTDLFVWDLDRIYRNRKRLQEFFILCKTYDCKIHSYRQNWLEDINSIPAPFDEIVMDLLINITGWMAQDESQKKSERVCMAVRRKERGTFSYKGNKWGRKSFPKQTIDRVLEFHRKGNSIRKIAELVKVYDKNNNERQISKSAVHKIIVENPLENDSK
ncbi:MAG: recombinase family protein [Burkholderiales bacterium]|nr:recombinase family protein [Bacteroidia bacterium]